MAIINLRGFPDKLHKQLKAAAKERGTSVKWILIQGAEQWLADQQPQKGRKGRHDLSVLSDAELDALHEIQKKLTKKVKSPPPGV